MATWHVSFRVSLPLPTPGSGPDPNPWPCAQLSPGSTPSLILHFITQLGLPTPARTPAPTPAVPLPPRVVGTVPTSCTGMLSSPGQRVVRPGCGASPSTARGPPPPSEPQTLGLKGVPGSHRSGGFILCSTGAGPHGGAWGSWANAPSTRASRSIDWTCFEQRVQDQILNGKQVL